MAARGPAGAEDVLSILREEMRRSMILMGAGSVKELNADWLVPANQAIS